MPKKGKKSHSTAEGLLGERTRPRFCRYFACSRAKSPISSIFSVNTLILATPGASRRANFVAILRDHDHVASSKFLRYRRFCRYFACSRSCCFIEAFDTSQILSLFCVITLICCVPFKVIFLRWPRGAKGGEADFVAILRDHATFYDSVINGWSRSCRYFARF